ncbi:Zn-dependent protease [Silvibacterium bohemicum]|uniref:Zn-dependent protease n=1 Tax=Silvibacterium bohemicum TaxID=1577686 RepID=A0A841JXC8_9BACT|nr:site-2 protease family protein [Silvibacterium bohemicum]MBB6145800.1 Zn-dependent protease [Silvibacterium bohemicum]
MRGWSFPLGKWFGVDLRIHTFFLLLLAFCLLSTSVAGVAAWRGFMLWMLLLMVVFVREIARLILAAYHGLQLRSVLLLPIGGLFSYANPESAERATGARLQLLLAVTGPIANLLFAGTIAGLIAGSAPGVPLLARPWITPTHLMRSTIWLSAMLGLLNLLPAYPLDAGRVLRGYLARTRGQAQATRAASGLGQGFGMLTMIAGLALLALPNTGLAAGLSPWLIMGGFFVFIGAQLEDQGVMFQSVVETVRMKDVMLTEFSTMSPSDTLADALYKAIHSLQDEFPVVRGANLVGVVSKQGILQALRSDGNGYVQSIMSRTFQVAEPEDSLGLMIRRIAGGRMSLVPIADAGRIVGIVTWQNLSNSMGLLAEHRRFERES